MTTKDSPGPATRLIHAGAAPARMAKTVGPPIQRGSTVLLPDAAALYDEAQPTYGRGGLATQETLMSALAELEDARAVCLFPSGLAALAGAMLAVLKAGDAVMTLTRPATRLIVLESPGSLTFEMQDTPAIAAAARAAGVLTLIDNTWAAGHFFKPLAHGIDISVQSLTKY